MSFDTLNITVTGPTKSEIEDDAWEIAARYYDGEDHFVHYTSDARCYLSLFAVDFVFNTEEPK